jgi:DNA uptake protein ComE-like DNA-binding protein
MSMNRLRTAILLISVALAGCSERKPARRSQGPSTTVQPVGIVVDINHASQAELEALPGIGAVYAARIIAGRPYAEKTQLRSQGILPEPTYERVREMIIAHQ